MFPVHPRTRRVLDTAGVSVPAALLMIEPVSYLDMLVLEKHARAILTDSGGIQEETSYLGIPCLTLRKNTERPITVSQGTNRLIEPGELAAELVRMTAEWAFHAAALAWWTEVEQIIAELAPAAVEGDQVLLDDWGTCGTYVRTQVALVKPNVKGVVINPFRLWPFYEVTIN